MTEIKKIFSIIKTEKLPNAETKIEAEVAFVELKPFRDEALKKLLKEAKLPGFRKGAVPEKMLIGKIGELSLLHEGAEILLRKIIPDILAETKAYPIVEPEISITKIAENNPLSFSIIVQTMPEVKLADYQAIAKKENNKKAEAVVVTDKDIEAVILQVRREKAHEELHEKLGADAYTHNHGEINDNDLPEFNDELAKTLGGFSNVADFKEKVKINIAQDKERKAHEKKRMEIAEAVIEKSKMEIPNALIENELNKMEAQFKHDIERMGVKTEDYLKHIKKTVADMRKDWREDAIKRVKLQLVLNEIAVKEKIEAPKEELDKEVKAWAEYYKEADPDRMRNYIESLIINQKVFEFLEKQN